MTPPDAEHLGAKHSEDGGHQGEAAEIADKYAVGGGDTGVEQHAVEQADKAPARRAEDDV